MSPLTPDERAIAASAIREFGNSEMLRALADKLEAEPDCETCGDRGWVVEGSLYDGSAEQLQCPDCEKYRAPEHIIRERDEAREALRDLSTAAVDYLEKGGLRRGEVVYRAIDAGRAVLEGVERTHALVPNPASERASVVLREAANANGRSGGDPRQQVRDTALARAFEAAACGERVVDWPGAA